MSDDKMDEITKKLDQLIDLVKNTTKVENHTHHHYPNYPTYSYPQTPWWTTGSGGTITGGGFTNTAAVTPGTTTTFSTNDPNGTAFNDTNTP